MSTKWQKEAKVRIVLLKESANSPVTVVQDCSSDKSSELVCVELTSLCLTSELPDEESLSLSKVASSSSAISFSRICSARHVKCFVVETHLTSQMHVLWFRLLPKCRNKCALFILIFYNENQRKSSRICCSKTATIYFASW